MDVIPAHFPSRRLFELDWNSLSDLELVALLIGPGTTERRALSDAQKLFDSVGSARRLQGVSYEELRSGTMKFNGKEIPTTPLSSYSLAVEIADELKRWILEEGFVLGVPQKTLPGPSA